MIPKFKVHDPDEEQALEDTVREALAQIVQQNYAAEAGHSGGKRR